MKIDRCGLDRVEHWIIPTLPSVVTIPVENNVVIYVVSRGQSDKELQAVAKKIADKLEIEPEE
jgi:hypothetical protein